ncbi:MAG: ABC transporter ATP-binding protein/permease [Cyanosarcina radialis HA8281-LM2]|jgi:ABC-type multidrug transport system fused ATPase/permease subunit|nr:ABC transporter ATP-binding protein/permease [Cyanosarcina radialis HA8281-LM2]
MTTARRTSIWHLLWQAICYARRLYWADTVLWLFISALPALPGLVIREFFNRLTDRSDLMLSSWGWIALFLTIGVARIVAIMTGRITKTQHRFTTSALVQRNLLAKVFDRPGAEALTASRISDRALSPGEVISFFREDVAQIEDNVVGTNEIFGEGVFALGSLALLASVNAKITLFVFLPLALMAAILHRATARIESYRRASRQATQQVTGTIGEMFAAVQAIQVAGAERSVLNRFRHLCDRRCQAMVQDRLLTVILDSSFENLASLGTGAVLFFAASSMRSPAGGLSVGDFALFVYYLSYVTYFFGFLGGFLALSKQSEVSFERMEGLVDEEALVLVEHHPLYLPTLSGRKPPLPQVQPVAAAEGRLQELLAIDLTYRYPNSDRGITEISLQLQPGSFTVITGAIGSGKTTLLRVLLGLLPLSAGEIYWNGQKVANPAQFFVPPRCAYTPQVPQLFSTTLRENILLGLPASDAQLQQAIALAAFDRDLAAMPDGLDTRIGSRGMRLSGGQIQRVAAARMLVRQPQLLVFDDLSSALDVETEQLLWSKLFNLNSSETWMPTFLVVSHRPAVWQRADRIILLDNGRVKLEGTCDDLPLA